MRVVNLTLYLSFCGLVGTGLLLWLRLIPGSKGGHGRTLLSLDRHDWGEWHLYLGIVFLVATLLHLVLNWPWLRKIAAKAHASLLWLGLLLGIAIVAFFLVVPIERGGRDERDREAESREGKGEAAGQGPRWARD